MRTIGWWCAMMWTALWAQDTVEHFTLNGHDYTVLTERYDEYESKGRVAKFYRDEPNYDLTYLFAVTLEEKTGGCGERSIEEGAYRIEGDTITVYTRWEREGKAYIAPKGYRVRVLRFGCDGNVTQTQGRLYVETARREYADEGMRYLDGGADTPQKQAALARYIADAERRFHARFVTDTKAREALRKEVFEALQQKVQQRWR